MGTLFPPTGSGIIVAIKPASPGVIPITRPTSRTTLRLLS